MANSGEGHVEVYRARNEQKVPPTFGPFLFVWAFFCLSLSMAKIASSIRSCQFCDKKRNDKKSPSPPATCNTSPTTHLWSTDTTHPSIFPFFLTWLLFVVD